MEICGRCGRTDDEVRLFDGIYVNESIKICEKCSLIGNIPIIKRPSTEQLKASEKGYGVRDRLMLISGLKKEEKKDNSIQEEIKKIEENPSIEKPQDLVFKLVDNFHWIIQTERRRKGLYIKQLADSIGESESAIKMLEKGIIPVKALPLIEKLEQFLNIKLIKRDIYEKMKEEATNLSKQSIVPLRKDIHLENPEKNPLGVGISGQYLKKIKAEEAENMVKQAIYEEKNPIARAREEICGVPIRMGESRKEKINGYNIIDIKNSEDKIEKDFEIDEQSTRENVAREQTEFDDEDRSKKYRDYSGRKPIKSVKSSVPSIYDLMRAKAEKDKKSLTGNDIKLERNENFNLQKNEGGEESIFRKIENVSSTVRKKRGFFSKFRKSVGVEDNKEEKIDFETGKLIKYE